MQKDLTREESAVIPTAMEESFVNNENKQIKQRKYDGAPRVQVLVTAGPSWSSEALGEISDAGSTPPPAPRVS